MSNLSKLTPHCPDLAGLAIQELAVDVLSPKSPCAAITLLVDHLKQKDMLVDYARVSSWCSGHFYGNRQMTGSQYQELVNIFWHQPGGIQTISQIYALAACIGKLSYGRQVLELAQNLDYRWLLSLNIAKPTPYQNILIPDERYPFESFALPREKIAETLAGMIASADVLASPILIIGQPGSGKSSLMSQLAFSNWGEQFGKKRIIYLNGGGLVSSLRAWHEEIFGLPPPDGIQLADLTNIIRQYEKNIRQIILVDEVSNIRFINPILEMLKGTRSVVILTPYLGLAIGDLYIDKRLKLTLTGFTLAEATEYYEKRWEKLKSEDLNDFEALNTTLRGNPLALFLACQHVEESEGFASLVHLLNCADTDIPNYLLTNTFLNLQIGFERLPGNLQKSFARLGAISRLQKLDKETLAALWADSLEGVALKKTGIIINQLQASICPFEPLQGKTAQWRLNQHLHLFAMSKFEETEPAEQLLASKWPDRL